jgi:radical SAM superfamily enzyme YgiQ (UPF0313 family)
MLVNLPVNEVSTEKTGKPVLAAENLSLAYLKASLQASEVSVKIIDAIAEDLTTEEIMAQVISNKPRLVGLSILEPTRHNIFAFCRQLKAELPGVKVILGGPLARVAPRELFKYEGIDLLCTGEGEYVIQEVIHALDEEKYDQIQGIAWKNGDDIHVNPPVPFVEDLDTLPWPARDTLLAVLKRGGIAKVVTSRGCFNHCAFCSIHRFIGSPSDTRWRTRTVADVIEELDFLRKTYDLGIIGFCEDNFFGSCEAGYTRAEDLARMLIRKGWGLKFALACRADDVEIDRFRLLKEAGLIHVEIGIESGAQSALNRWTKGISVGKNYRALEILDQLGIDITAGFIMFDAHTTLDELEQNRVLLRRCSAFKNMSCILESRLASRIIPYPGTPIRKRYHNEHLLHSEELRLDEFDDYTFCDQTIQNLYKIMDLWETKSAPVRQLCWYLALKYPDPGVMEKGHGFLEQLMDLSMGLFENTLEAAKAGSMTWDPAKDSPWPVSFNTRLNRLAKEALAIMPADNL